MQLLEKTIKNHKDYTKAVLSSAEGPRGEDELNATLRRIIIKSLLVVLNFVYSKKYLKDVISSLAQPMTVDTKPHSGSGGKKQASAAAKCPMEEENALEVFIKLIELFKESHHLQGQPSAGSPNSRAGKSAQATAGQATAAPALGSVHSQAADAAVAQGYSSYPDFRDINEEALYLFCSFAMSTNFSVSQLCKFVLPFGHSVLSHTISSIKKSPEVTAADAGGIISPSSPSNKAMIMSNTDAAGAGLTSVNNICSLQCINAVLESIVIILRKPERNGDILRSFDLASMISAIIEVIRIFELKQDPAMQPFENKIQSLSQNLELIIKLVFFSPQKLKDSSISLIHKMLNYRRYRKTGFFAIYCTALMIQDCRSQ